MKSSEVAVAYTKVKKFNEIAGNLGDVTDESIDNQISYIFEELQETITAFEGGDKIELLDGACDLFVTVAGLMQKLVMQGYNVAEALDRVNDNNLSKFPVNLEPADENRYWPEFNDKHNRWVLKDETGKVRKPADFVSVDLTGCIPKEGY